MTSCPRLRSLLVSCLLGTACAAPSGAPPDAELAFSAHPLSSISCGERMDTGYVRGSSFPITVVTVDGKPVERETANAYYVMAQEAARAGVEIRIVSGFRTMAQQEYLYHCYTSCSCNSCNLAARPGYSNHQSGHALDLNTSASGVLSWLNANAGRFGFRRTVSSEPWHWEWWGGGPGGGPCGRTCAPHCEGSRIVNADCGDGDCAAFGATCVDDALGVRCASVFCPARGEATVCVDDTHIGTCDDGAIGVGDCAAYGAFCSTAGGGEARCVSVFCVDDAAERPRAHDVCLPDGRLARCTDAGGLEEPRACPDGTSCQADAEGRFACLRGGASPTGALDAAACDSGVRGWAMDPDEPEASIRVHVYFDGAPGAAGATGVPTDADLPRAGPCDAVEPCDHGFALDLPYALFDAAPHEVTAYGINLHAGSHAALAGSPSSVRCDAPRIDGVLRALPSPETAGAWGLTSFRDERPTRDEELSDVPDGPALEAAPRLVRAGSERWLLDGAVRRFVDDRAARGWRLGEDAFEERAPGSLEAIPEGPALRPRPMLVRRGEALYLVDDAPVPEERAEAPEPPETGAPPGSTPEPSGMLVGSCAVRPLRAPSLGWLAAAAALLVARRRRRSSRIDGG